MITLPWRSKPSALPANVVPHACPARVIGTLARARQIGQHVLTLASTPGQDLLHAVHIDERRCHALGAIRPDTTPETLWQTLTEVLEWAPKHGHPDGTVLLAADDLPRAHLEELLGWSDRLTAAGVELLIVEAD